MKKEALKKLELKKQKSLEYSIKDATASSITTNIEATYIPQLALALKGTSFQVGLINAFTGLLSPLAQLFGDKLLEKYPRRKIFKYTLSIQTLLLFGIAGLAFIFHKGLIQNQAIYILIALYTFISICSGIIYPSWFSLIGDLTSQESRGKFLARRNVTITLVGLLVLPTGFLLDKAEALGYLMLGFSALFIISGIARMISRYYLVKHYEPKLKLEKGYYFSILSFVKRFDDVGEFAVYYAVFNLVLMIASPFFAVYMRKGLQFDYLEIIIISMASSVFYILFSPLMGRISDKYGNIKLFYISTLLFAINPFAWALFKSVWTLALIPQLITGLANATMGIAVSNFILNMTKPNHRALCMSYLNILAGAGVFVGSISGGLILKTIPETFPVSPFIALFIISGLLRFLVSIFFVKKLKETESNIKRFPSAKISLFHPLRSINSELNIIKRLSHTK